MNYAIRNDLQGWRSVGGPDDCNADEHYSETQPAPVEPDPQEVINAEALKYLAQTDWYIIRHQETGETVPVDVLSARQAARQAVVR